MITKFGLYNESLKDKLKGKSEGEIKNIIKKLPLNQQFNKYCQYGYLEYVKKLLKDSRVDPSNNNSAPIRLTV